ncbi:von Willebrand factor-like [Lutzomyia longipalpis]|uniref:von Willebrand factor-like n=1 Tax=Lutzomyia longipalpis TaxID=7200 RepID=UPI002483FAE0|nr:von Willebrand factor-like [Lutzomyia longipalpis]
MESCSEPFKLGCYCREGFTRFVNGSCVPHDWCPCPGDNEMFKSVKSCQDDCSASGRCRSEECFKGCHCRNGFVRVDGRCVTEAENSCPRNEHFKCGRRCEEDCNLGDVDECRRRTCVDGCYCNDGYLRINGVCVHVEQAEPLCNCPPGQKFTCKSDCLESCYEFPGDCDESDCRWGCHCPNDVLKRQRGDCINVNQCDCNRNEEPRNGRLCDESCSMSSRECRLSGQSTGRKCFCASGYCRENRGDQCRRN